jgi:two-component system response regulator CpxR
MSNGTTKVLLIEDDPGIREMLQETLSILGYDVATATNGQEGLDYLAHHPKPSVVLLDLMMPIMTGWEFMDALTKSKQFTGLPVLVISAYTHKPLPNGIVGFMRKPIDLDNLLLKLNELGLARTA